MQLKATVTPKKASNKKVIWSSSNKKVATVTSKRCCKGYKERNSDNYSKKLQMVQVKKQSLKLVFWILPTGNKHI